MQDDLTPTSLARISGISVSYASMILSDDRKPPLPLAIKIFRTTGRKFGPIANATDDEIDVFERVQERAA